MSSTLFDLVRCSTPTVGTGSVVAIGPALPGFRSFANAGIPDGTTVSIAISDSGGAAPQGLTGRAVYSFGAQTLTITQITASTNSGAMIALSGSAQIAISALAQDIVPASVFATRSAAASATIDPAVNVITTGGFRTAGDGGGARYFRYTGTSPGGFQSADGAWWAINEVEPNVMQFGAYNQYNSGMDSTGAFQDLIDYVSFQPPGGATSRGGVAIVPAGSYYVGNPPPPSPPTGLTLPNTHVTVHLRGGGKSTTFVHATANVNLLTIDGPCKVSDIFFSGWNSVQNTSNTIQINTGNVTLQDIEVDYGQAGIQIGSTGGNCKLHRVIVRACLNQSLHSLSTVNCIDCDFDTQWPVGMPPYGTAIGAWSANASVTVGKVVTLVQNGLTLYLQCITPGTTGSSQPNVLGYDTDIPDGSAAAWQLALTSGTVGVLLDGDASFSALQCEFTNCDFSIAAQFGLQMQNISGGGNVPQIVNLTECSFADSLQGGAYFAAGGYAMISNCQFSGASLSGSAAIIFGTNWSGPATITGCSFFGQSSVSFEATNAIILDAGANTVISGNYFGPQASYAISVGPGVSNFAIVGNTFNSSNGTVIVNAGPSQFYNISNNILNGVAIVNHGTSNSTTTPNN